jgi:hypothetical protein
MEALCDHEKNCLYLLTMVHTCLLECATLLSSPDQGSDVAFSNFHLC